MIAVSGASETNSQATSGRYGQGEWLGEKRVEFRSEGYSAFVSNRNTLAWQYTISNATLCYTYTHATS